MGVDDPTCPFIKNMLVLDNEGKRVAVKYYGDEKPSVDAQSAFETSLFQKTARAVPGPDNDVMLLDREVICYTPRADLCFYVTASTDENELIVSTVLSTLVEALDVLLRGDVDKRTLLENLDLVMLVFDEIVDSGLLLETDAGQVAQRVAMRQHGAGDAEEAGPGVRLGPGGGLRGMNLANINEQTVKDAFNNVRETVLRNLLK
ncbi:unnamed protein product [Pedinophyceae sp. YPF-701]|nr:unnamed protein product [Pedinophyceae sp. YPF-701]